MRLGIIGRGIAALATAQEAHAKGWHVTLHGPVRGDGDASYAAHGFSIHKGLLITQSDFFRAKMAGQRLLWDWLEETERASGAALPRVKGLWEPYWTADDFTRVAARVYRRAFTGCFRMDHRPAPSEWAGLFRTLPLGTFYYSDDFWFDPRPFLDVIEARLIAGGVTILDPIVTSLGRSGAQWSVGTGMYDCVVIAAGAGTNRLLAHSNFPLLAMKSVLAAVVETRHKTVATPLAFTRFGGGAVIGPASRLPHEAASAALFPFAEQSFVGEGRIVHGTRMRTRDKSPFVGPIDDAALKGLYVLTGLGRNGMELARGAARNLVDQIRTGQPEASRLPLNPEGKRKK